jgi:hypothetical protein
VYQSRNNKHWDRSNHGDHSASGRKAIIIYVPQPLAYARARIENTILDVGAIGPAAEEIEILLGQLTQLTPESDVPDQINLGLKALGEYFQRRFQSNE